MFYTVNKKMELIEEISLPVSYSSLNPRLRKAVRLQYVKKQNNRCFYCNEKLESPPPNGVLALVIHKDLFPEGFFDYPVHLHHNHNTDLTIGAVHAWCNAVLWEHENE